MMNNLGLTWLEGLEFTAKTWWIVGRMQRIKMTEFFINMFIKAFMWSKWEVWEGKKALYIFREDRGLPVFLIESSHPCIPLGDIHVISKQVLEPFNPHPLSLVCNLAWLQICSSVNVFGWPYQFACALNQSPLYATMPSLCDDNRRSILFSVLPSR